jgi:hypothetical protein
MSKAPKTFTDQRLKQSRFIAKVERLIVEEPPLLALLYCLMENALASVVEGSREPTLRVQQQQRVESPTDRQVPLSSAPSNSSAADQANSSNSTNGHRGDFVQKRSLNRLSQENQPLADQGRHWMRYGLVHFSTSATVQSLQLSFDFRELATHLSGLVAQTLRLPACFQWGTLDTDDEGRQIKAIFYDPRTSRTLETGYCGVEGSNHRAQQRIRKSIDLFVKHPLLNSLIAKQIEHADFQLAGAHEAAPVRIQDRTDHPFRRRASERSEHSQVLSLIGPSRGRNIDEDLTYAFSQVQNFLDGLDHLDPLKSGTRHTRQRCLFFGPRDLNAMRLTSSLRREGVRVRLAQYEDYHPTLSPQDIALINALVASPTEWPSAYEKLILQHPKVWIIRPAQASASAALDLLARQRREPLPKITFIENLDRASPRRLRQVVEAACESNELTTHRVQRPRYQMGNLERRVLARYVGGLSMALASSDAGRIDTLLHQMAGWLGLADDNALPQGFREDVVSLYRHSDRSNEALLRLVLVGASWVAESSSMSDPVHLA